MTARLQTLLLLFTILVAIDIGAQRLKLPRSILLVIAGIALALVPGLPRFELAPEVVLLVILPPLIYTAGVAMSWREFRLNLKPIALLAVGCVVFTTCAVAAAAHGCSGWSGRSDFCSARSSLRRISSRRLRSRGDFACLVACSWCSKAKDS